MSGPHDLFARYTFGYPERAEAELRAVLPPQVVSQVDWSSLRRESGSVVDPELRETESDLLPVIIPLVMYHGLEGGWTAPRRVEELFDLPAGEEERERWGALVPRFEYLLDDLTAEREEALRARPGPPLARLAWLVLRHGRSEELARKLPEWVALFAQVQAGPEGAEHLVVLLRYLLWVGNKAVREAAGRVLHSVLDEQRAEELMRSYGEELIEQGLQQGLERGLQQGLARGREEGLQRGRAEDILRILAARGVRIDEEARQRVLTCTDVATLDRWFDRSLNATTLSDVLDDLSV